jgi:transcriptional regulator of acetoin/glycerol metabolism
VKKLRIEIDVMPGARFEDAVDAFRRELLFAALDAHGGNIPQAAKDLGRSRSGVWRELWERHGVREYVAKAWSAWRKATVRAA